MTKKTFKITCPKCGEIAGEFFERDRKILQHCIMSCIKCEYHWSLRTGKEFAAVAEFLERINSD